MEELREAARACRVFESRAAREWRYRIYPKTWRAILRGARTTSTVSEEDLLCCASHKIFNQERGDGCETAWRFLALVATKNGKSAHAAIGQ